TMTARLPPSVGVFEPFFNGGIPYVGVDDTEGARKALDLLLAEGHRKIAFIGYSRTRLAYTRRPRWQRPSADSISGFATAIS
ncbi:hypothetical protein ACC733_38310, partial [Rhizobium johnstonii]